MTKLPWSDSKNDLRTHENIRKVAADQVDDYTSGWLLDYLYLKKILS